MVIAHSYQYSFAPNKRWTSFYAPSAEICDYIQNIAETYGATRFIKLHHEVTSCQWDDTINKWYEHELKGICGVLSQANCYTGIYLYVKQTQAVSSQKSQTL